MAAPLTRADIHSDANLSGMSWWFGDITREAAEDLLLSLDRDTFLVRSSSRPGCYACSLYDAATGQIDHTLVVRTSTGGFKFAKKSAAAAQEYGSLVELILSSPLLSAYAAPDPHAADDPVANARKANERRAQLKPQVTGAATLRGNHNSGGSATLRKPLREWESDRTEADTKTLLSMEQLLMREIPILQKQAEQIKRKQTQFFEVPAELKKLHVSRHPPPGDGESLVQVAGAEVVPAADGLHLFTAMDRIDHTTAVRVPEDDLSEKDKQRFWKGELPTAGGASDHQGPRKRLSTWMGRGEKPPLQTQGSGSLSQGPAGGQAAAAVAPAAGAVHPAGPISPQRPELSASGSSTIPYEQKFPLHAAVERSDKKAVKKLLGNDARLWESLNDSRESPLIVALARCPAMVPVLLKGARKLGTKIDLNKKLFGDGSSLLHMAMQTSSKAAGVLLLLKEKSLNVGVRNDRDNTALHYFAQYYSGTDYLQVLDALLEQGGIVLARTPNASGETPLHRTVLNNATSVGAGIAEVLVKRVGRELVLHTNKRRATALHFACSMNRPLIVELLLPLSDLSAVTADGRNAEQIAEQSNFTDILAMFRKQASGPTVTAAVQPAVQQPAQPATAPVQPAASFQPPAQAAAQQFAPAQTFDPRGAGNGDGGFEHLPPSNPFFSAPESGSNPTSQGNVDDVNLTSLIPSRPAPPPPQEDDIDDGNNNAEIASFAPQAAGMGAEPAAPAVPAGEDWGVVLWDYIGRTEDEITAPADAQVRIVQRYGFDPSDTAWFCLEFQGSRGFIPSNYVQPL